MNSCGPIVTTMDLIASPESKTLEFKRDLSSPKPILKSLVAFANSAGVGINMISELEEYEREVLYPLATEQVEIDLDDGVKVNYPKLSAALKKIVGLDAAEE